MLTTKIERTGDTTLKLDVDVAPELLGAALDETVTHLGQGMRMPGFRPGKVPAQAVLARVGREAAIVETVNRYLGDWYVTAVTNAGIRPVADPQFDFGDLPTDPSQGFAFSATVEVAPKPKLPDLATLMADRPVHEDVSRFVDEVVEMTLRGAATLEPTGAGAKRGDEVVVDFACEIDGNEVRGASAVGYEAKIGDGRLLFELEQAILDQTAGAELDVPVSFPNDHPMRDLAGRDATFRLKLREVADLQLPELTDDVASQVSEFDTAKALREDIERGVRERLSEQTDQLFRANAVDALAKAAEVEVPKVLLEQRQQEIYRGVSQNLGRQGLSIETYLATTGKSQDDMMAELEESADLDMRRELAVQALAEEAGIAVTDEDIRSEIEKHLEHGARAGEEPETVDEAYGRVLASGRIDQLRAQLLIERTVDHLISKITANEVPFESEAPEPEHTDDAAEDGVEFESE